LTPSGRSFVLNLGGGGWKALSYKGVTVWNGNCFPRYTIGCKVSNHLYSSFVKVVPLTGLRAAQGCGHLELRDESGSLELGLSCSLH
jgi:hypothetical protein